MIGPMAGKAPLLLAVVLFSIGTIGLALSSAERASWGPFQPPRRAAVQERAAVPKSGAIFAEPPSLSELLTPQETALAAEEPQALVATPWRPATPAPAETPEPEANETPPVTVVDVAADGDGVSAATAAPPPVPPVHIANVASGDSDDSSGQPPMFPGQQPAPNGPPTAPE